MTTSEQFIADLCRHSFLPFWSYPSPVGKKGKELCDLLVVCGNIIIIISVKDITPSTHEDEFVVYKRWVKKAIEDSISQIYGAESFLEKANFVRLKNPPLSIPLPPKTDRQIFRIAIAFGRKDYYPFPIAHNAKKFVHVLDETATETLLRELDTITDFTSYLFAKEQIISVVPAIFTQELNFLAHYVNQEICNHSGRRVDIPEEKSWEFLTQSQPYQSWKHDIEASYLWDIMIQSFYFDLERCNKPEEKRVQVEAALRLITLEKRIDRIALAQALEETNKTALKARIFIPAFQQSHIYVFLHLDEHNFKSREQELSLRCIVARAEVPEFNKVVGVSVIRTSDHDFIFDVHFLHIANLDKEFTQLADRIKNELGYFKDMRKTQIQSK